MLKKIGLVLILIFFLTGCNIVKVDENSFDSIIKTILYKDTQLSNVNFEGYKFYLPRGLDIIDKTDNNLKIKDKNNNNYYLYVDTVAYYYDSQFTHEIDNSIFYSTNLNYKNNFGYVDITFINDKYFLEVMYNYAKIESYVSKDDLYDTFLYISYILSTISFSDFTIDYQLGNNKFESTVEEFNIFESKKDNDNFLQYVEEFDKYETTNNTNKDQDIIETE